MDFSKLDSNDKLGFYGAIIVIVGVILTVTQFGGAGALWLNLLLALAMIAILFLPQWSPQTTLPGSKGSLMLIVGGIAAIGSLLSLLGLVGVLGLLGLYSGLWVVGLVIGIIGGLVMGWAGWQAFQAEGGKFQIGSGGGTPPAPPPGTPPPPPPPASPPGA